MELDVVVVQVLISHRLRPAAVHSISKRKESSFHTLAEIYPLVILPSFILPEGAQCDIGYLVRILKYDFINVRIMLHNLIAAGSGVESKVVSLGLEGREDTAALQRGSPRSIS